MNREETEKVLAYIEEHICEKINLRDLSDLAGYTPFYFSKLFSENMGMPVTGYIRIRKLQYALVSLLEGRKVLDVALFYSFDSHEGFTRAFKQLFGSTPSTVRKYLTSYQVPEYVVPESINRRICMEENSTMHQIIYEFLEQSLEEAKDGFCTSIDITVLADGRIRMKDNGRGLPLSTEVQASQEVLDKILAGKPITNVEYSQMGDLLQAGLQTANSLCEELQIIVTRDGHQFQQDYVRGIAQHEVQITASQGASGTELLLKPDTAIFEDTRFSAESIQEWIDAKTQGIDGLNVNIMTEK